MNLQSSLGSLQRQAIPRFDQIRVARVVNIKDFLEKGLIEVAFTTGGMPVPVQIVENGSTNIPEQGDWVLIGYIEGTKHRPYFVGYIKDLYRTSNMVQVKKDKIEIKFPVTYDVETHKKEFKHFVMQIQIPDPNGKGKVTDPQITIQMPDTIDDKPTRLTLTNELVKVESAKKVEVVSKETVSVEAEKDITVLSKTGAVNVTAKKSSTINVTGDVTLKVSGTVTVASSAIKLGSGAVEGVPLGVQLKTWLDGHTHPAPGGTTSAPSIASPVPSVKVLTE